MCFFLNVLILKHVCPGLGFPCLWALGPLVFPYSDLRRSSLWEENGVTGRAWESVNLIRWSQADVPTGVRGRHQTSGFGGDYLAGERRGACGDLLEGMSPAQIGPHLPISSWCDCVAVVNSKSVPKLFPALDTFPLCSVLCNTLCQVVTFLEP